MNPITKAPIRDSCVCTTVLLAAFLAIYAPAAFCQGSAIQANVINDPAAPVQIDSMNPAAPSTKLPPQIAARSVAFDVTVRNSSPQAIILYGISYDFEDADTAAHLTRVCFESSTFDPTTPPLPPGTTKTLNPSFARSPRVKSVLVKPTVDLVLLADGHYYGKDVCGALGRYQSLLEDRRVYAEVLLNYLQANGAEKTLDFLRKELAHKDSTDQVLLNAKEINGQK